MKASYLSHGPCLPEIVYHGSYGTNGEVALTAEASTPRTDDHSKVFLRLRYDFRAELSAKDAWFFRLGYGKVFCPKIAFGNREGLIREIDAPVGVKVGDCVLDREVFSGAAPWWLGFPGSKVPNFPSGSRGLVIRSYRANLGGKTFDTPSLTLLVGETGKFARTEKGYESNPGGSETLGHVDAAIVPPLEIEKFQPGDSVELELELDVVPVEADDYYGPNEEFRKHLAENPASWKTFHRAAVGNDLQVDVQGGTLLRKLPLVIQADPDAPSVQLQIQGGAGAVPVRFQGLASPTGYQLSRQLDAESLPLNQAATDNDFWETSFDPATQTYTRTYNLPLDGAGTTAWVLSRIK